MKYLLSTIFFISGILNLSSQELPSNLSSLKYDKVVLRIEPIEESERIEFEEADLELTVLGYDCKTTSGPWTYIKVEYNGKEYYINRLYLDNKEIVAYFKEKCLKEIDPYYIPEVWIMPYKSKSTDLLGLKHEPNEDARTTYLLSIPKKGFKALGIYGINHDYVKVFYERKELYLNRRDIVDKDQIKLEPLIEVAKKRDAENAITKAKELEEETIKREAIEKKIILEYGLEIGQRIIEKKAWIGMTEEMLIESWGKPDNINTSIYSWGIQKQYVYVKYNYQNSYVYFENGICTSIQK